MSARSNLIKQRLFHPLAVLSIAVGATAIFAVFAYTIIGIRTIGFLLYMTLIGVPFVAFGFDRAERWATFSPAQRRLDALTIAIALTRAILPVPLISGHAVFLSYALLTTRSAAARTSAFAVLLQVIYYKTQGPDITLIGGLILGGLLALVWRGRPG